MLRVNEFRNSDLQVKEKHRSINGPIEFVRCKWCSAVLGEKGKEKREVCDYICRRNYKAAHTVKKVKEVKQKKDWFYKKWE